MNRKKVIGRLAAVCGLALLFAVFMGLTARNEPGPDELRRADVFTVRQGPLDIEVSEAGIVKPRDQIIIKSEVEGQTTILSIVEEGKQVKEGDLLIELDASQLEDKKVDQEIRVRNAESAFVNARENLEVVKNQSASDVDQAELKAGFARQDLQKYVDGEYPQELKEAQSKITVAEEELRRAEERREWSRVLFKEKYISQTELDSDVLAAKKAELDLELARSQLELLKNYTYGRKLAELESEVKQTAMALERARRKASADVIQAEADLLAKESEYQREKAKLTKLNEQITKTTILAPADGLVIYATTARGSWRGNEEPLAAGQEVKERQELIYLPKASSMLAEVKIHESSLDKVKVGLPARITVDALPGKLFSGEVASISPLPDPTSMWFNSDLKLYTTVIYLDGEDGSGLKTGMSCRADILIEHFENVLAVPVQAVVREEGKPTVYVLPAGAGSDGRKARPRQVETGLDNNIMIIVKSGLEQGDRVLLSPPLDGK